MHLSKLLLALVSLHAPSALARNWSKSKDAILLSSVKALTLRDGAMTTHRRVEAMPQLVCVGGNAKGLYTVDRMRCTNSGHEYDREDIQWTCKADLPIEFKLGGTDVICEGYDSPDDPYVLKGSCAVEYRLVLTKAGEEKYGLPKDSWWGSSRNGGHDRYDEGGSTLGNFIFWCFFLFVLGVIIWSVWTGGGNNGQGGRPRGPRWGGGGGGYDGFDDHNDPPPPYTPRAPRPKSTYNSSAGSNSWRPGFWSGTAAGAAGAYAANQWANRNNRTRYDQPQAGPSNWFGGGGGRSDSFAAGPSRSSSTPSSTRYESSGFGGTRRR
ncbi:Store-operated calcium entry-associated regulatory factor [Cercospora beticola]|uniref:Store-operated calcium entry-associated regulatory factor n=1 Tax=Cercospora beticola TaxID=122368 RepID=A0A2G5HJE1_CERBT|nr:Store-operated calcium entry-associated regulatory factor [Cercospora beticola]PIA92332.1 Store-operated calcium entry-associated regulatory factor [Cercospora beticola]WPB05820.1 hypothetical protein RHO25_010474 [Cercospora beticola]